MYIDCFSEDHTASVHAKKNKSLKILINMEESKDIDDHKMDECIPLSTLEEIIFDFYYLDERKKLLDIDVMRGEFELLFLSNFANRERNLIGKCAQIKCLRRSELKCPKCQHISYCSTTCKEKNLSIHKLYCEAWRLHKNCKKHCIYEVD